MDMTKTEIEIGETIERRLRSRICLSQILKITEVSYVVAGGACLAEEPHDYDVYAANKDHPFTLYSIIDRAKNEGWTFLAETRNSVTLKDKDGKVFQFCAYAKEDAKALIASFDFAHCQVGVVVSDGDFGDGVSLQTYFTEDFLKAMATQRTFYVGSEYPLASLMRIVKHAKRGLYGPGDRAHMGDMLRIFGNILSRGYRDFDDFKDQLDAVDLAYADKAASDVWPLVRDKLIVEETPAKSESPAPDDDEMPFK